MKYQRENLQLAEGLRCARLSTEQCRKIHDATLEVLERVGARLYNQEALDIMARAGVPITDGNRAHVPARLVEWALKAAPSSITVYDRTGQPAMDLGGYRSYYGTGSDCFNIIDHRTWQRRRAVLQDVVEGVTVCDALDNIDFVMCMFLPSDVSGEIADRYQMAAMLNHTTKPIVYVNYDASGCVDSVAMAEAVAGGADALRARPFAVSYINVTTGLRHNEESLEKLIFLARRGLPFLYICSGLGGLTAPMTVAGSMVVVNAGTLTGLVLSQLIREGTPVIIPGFGGESVDMRNMGYAHAVPDYKGTAQSMAHFYDKPMFTTAGVCDAKVVDQQAAAEAALTLMVDAQHGGNLVHDLGYMEAGLCGSLAQLVICDELVQWIKAYTVPIQVDDETLALDLIEAIGPDGQFLEQDHTFRHYKDRWYPRLIDRNNLPTWQARGSKTMADRAADRASEILASHKAPPLAPEAADQLQAIVARTAAQHTAS